MNTLVGVAPAPLAPYRVDRMKKIARRLLPRNGLTVTQLDDMADVWAKFALLQFVGGKVK